MSRREDKSSKSRPWLVCLLIVSALVAWGDLRKGLLPDSVDTVNGLVGQVESIDAATMAIRLEGDSRKFVSLWGYGKREVCSRIRVGESVRLMVGSSDSDKRIVPVLGLEQSGDELISLHNTTAYLRARLRFARILLVGCLCALAFIGVWTRCSRPGIGNDGVADISGDA